MHPLMQHKALTAETASPGMLFSPLLLFQRCPCVHHTRLAAPSPPLKDWEKTTDPKKKMQPLFSSKNFLSARSPGLGKFGELKKLMSTEKQVWYRMKHRGKHRFPPPMHLLSSPRNCSSPTAMPSLPLLAGLTPAPSQLEFWHPAAFLLLLLCPPGSLLFWQCRLLL